MRPLRALTIDFDPIVQAMRDLSRLSEEYFLHKTTGKVVVLSRALIRYLAQGTEVDRETLPEWEAQMVPVAREIVIIGSPDFVRIPEGFGCPDHMYMLRFAETVSSEKMRQQISAAMRGRGSCDRFKQILKDHNDERHRWEQFRADCAKEYIRQWLETVGILAIDHNLKASRASSK